MIVLDGPMGTQLAARGVPTPLPGWSAHALETAPEVVTAIHADYATAGATVHRTNTFRTQRVVIGDRWRSLVTVAVDCARRATLGRPVRIAGVIAPLADCYRPDLAPPPDVCEREHLLLARALAAEGVDLLLCETFPDPGEAVAAVTAAAATGLPVWVALTAGPDGTLLSPEAMFLAGQRCVTAGASAVLVDCSPTATTAAWVARLAALRVPVGAYANAFAPEVDAERYLACARSWVDLGASIVGGCCGTSPAHVAALARTFR